MINGACLEILEACVQAGFSKEDKRAAPKARECARVQGSDLVRHQWAVASAGLGWQEGVCHPSTFSAGTTLQMKAPLRGIAYRGHNNKHFCKAEMLRAVIDSDSCGLEGRLEEES